jgi:ribonuclease HII
MARRDRSLRLAELVVVDRRIRRKGARLLAGVDESGMGPLAGPVVAAAVILPRSPLIEGVDDSKLLTRRARDRLDVEIRQIAIAIGVAVVDVDEIDSINVYQAGLKAMRLAVQALSVRPDHVLVDARTIPELDTPQTPLVGGDRRSYSIAAASIVAKAHRDRVMGDLARLYPAYGFERHAGYGTLAHRQALRALGPCPAHRRSFRWS